MKQAVAGHGKAAKAQVQEMVKRLLQLPGLPGKDAADALGLAITHAHVGRGDGSGSRQASGDCAQGQRDVQGRGRTGIETSSATRGSMARQVRSSPDSTAPQSAPRKSRTPRSAST